MYKRYQNIESANIVCCFVKNTHLEIIRQKEYNLNHDISLKLTYFRENHQNIKKNHDIIRTNTKKHVSIRF